MSDYTERLNQALVGRYVIEREIGSGGMATVYLADDVRHNRKVALKVLRPELARALGTERFLREIEIAARLTHPHILPLHDSGEADGFLFYVMPYIEGESLRERLAKGVEVPMNEVVRWLRDVADALAHAHRHGVVHRDVKPDNVMLSERHALVTDFGVAKAISDAQAGPKLTTAGVSIGTPTYMSPEQAAGETAIDHRADIYSLGVLAYEALAGRPPFDGPTAQAIMASHVTEPPPPIAERRPELPASLAATVMRCLEKRPENRWQSADDLLAEFEALATPGRGVASVPGGERGLRRQPVLLFAAVAVVVAVLAVWGIRTARQASVLRWAQEEAIPEVRRLLEADQYFAAWMLGRRIEARLPGDPSLAELWPSVAYVTSIRSEPPGAIVLIGDPDSVQADWIELGTTPLTNVAVPRTYMRVLIEKPGFDSFEGRSFHWRFPEAYVLDEAGTAPKGMVRVSGGETNLQLSGLEHLDPLVLASYYLDRHEVTNREFKAFVDSGGYERPELWDHEFVLEGHRLPFEAAIRRFTDRTGRRGPATWEAGTYPSGRDDYPVSGVSWYEAAAYAKFAGKQLPTIYHWSWAAETWASAWIVPRSNFGAEGPSPVGSNEGVGPYGTLDMAGNVREWCANAIGEDRYILGGGWDDATYAFTDAYAQHAFDRYQTNGIRLALYEVNDSSLEEAGRSLVPLVRDFAAERPISDEVIAAYRRVFDYDPVPLNAVVEEADSSHRDWIVERVAYDAAYGERMSGVLFLPRNTPPPYQTIVFYPGSGALFAESSRELRSMSQIEFLVRSGRALLHPVYKSTYERGDSLKSDYANETAFYRDHVVQWVKDYRRSLDYLATRSDVDTTAFAYYGYSWGGYLGGLIPAVEPRLKVSVLYVAGLEMQRARPEVEPYNYLPRITIPVLMLNGKYDHFFPEETSQRPMFEALGTPAQHKRWVVYEGGHFVPYTTLIAEVLDWLDRYLGPTR